MLRLTSQTTIVCISIIDRSENISFKKTSVDYLSYVIKHFLFLLNKLIVIQLAKSVSCREDSRLLLDRAEISFYSSMRGEVIDRK